MEILLLTLLVIGLFSILEALTSKAAKMPGIDQRSKALKNIEYKIARMQKARLYAIKKSSKIKPTE